MKKIKLFWYQAYYELTYKGYLIALAIQNEKLINNAHRVKENARHKLLNFKQGK